MASLRPRDSVSRLVIRAIGLEANGYGILATIALTLILAATVVLVAWIIGAHGTGWAATATAIYKAATALRRK
jgi:hypothetical protein